MRFSVRRYIGVVMKYYVVIWNGMMLLGKWA